MRQVGPFRTYGDEMSGVEGGRLGDLEFGFSQAWIWGLELERGLGDV